MGFSGSRLRKKKRKKLWSFFSSRSISKRTGKKKLKNILIIKIDLCEQD